MGKYKRRNRRRRQSFMLLTELIIILALLGWMGYVLTDGKLFNRQQETEVQTEVQTETVQSETEKETAPESEKQAQEVQNITEEEIYTYLQGPVSWKNKIDWSGEWSIAELADSTFGDFGCGMCCLANIYSTFSPYNCSPLDMYYYAQEVSTYSPGGGYGAIDWPELLDTFQKCGVSSQLRKKDKTYEKFQDHIEESMAAIVLVSCYEDASYWETTEGHYVTIWKYDRESDTVFLGDSGNPDHNRSRIPLSYLYSAMKTSSTYQYQVIESYQESENTWKHDGITHSWNIPNYMK